MNTSERIPLISGASNTAKYINIQLEQEVESFQYMTLDISTKDAYQDFNSDYGVLVGRVIANGGIGIPNAKISIFIPLTNEDAEDGDISSIYPYKTPRDKNAQGRRYNLLPRVSVYDNSTGTYKPKQPFGSFPIKPEIVTNSTYLGVYKKYYKYTALTNQFGDYMIFGVPIGVHTVHMSVDITDIGKYSMNPASMIKAGYPANLFVDDGKLIKPSDDLNDLPNIETQEISVEIIPFWGDNENFSIGITRQDFRIRAVLESTFTIFGTSMTMGIMSTIGDPDKYNDGSNRGETNFGFYFTSSDTPNNVDVRTYRPAELIISVFTYNTSIPISDITSGNVDPQDPTTIILLSKSQYFEYNQNGNFLLSIPCNRRKVVTDDNGNETDVADDSPYGVFTEFYGMITVEYTDLDINKTYSHKFNGGPSPAHQSRGKLKIPQTIALKTESNTNESQNDAWRKEYQKFNSGEIYSIAQFLPTRSSNAGGTDRPDAYNIDDNDNSTNRLNGDYNWIGGTFFKVAGKNNIADYQNKYDTSNYIVDPFSGSTPEFKYDFPDNATTVGSTDSSDRFFGAQWLNLCLVFPQFVWAFRDGNYRTFNVADVFFDEYKNTFFTNDNTQTLFAGIKNTRNFLRGDAYQTAFINIPKSELAKLNQTFGNTATGRRVLKGINVNKWNNDPNNDFTLTSTYFKYRTPIPNSTGNSKEYNKRAWDSYYPYSGSQVGDKPTAYIFKGMYENDCVQMLFDFNII